jgi:hypothetical protein
MRSALLGSGCRNKSLWSDPFSEKSVMGTIQRPIANLTAGASHRHGLTLALVGHLDCLPNLLMQTSTMSCRAPSRQYYTRVYIRVCRLGLPRSTWEIRERPETQTALKVALNAQGRSVVFRALAGSNATARCITSSTHATKSRNHYWEIAGRPRGSLPFSIFRSTKPFNETVERVFVAITTLAPRGQDQTLTMSRSAVLPCIDVIRCKQ